MISKNACDRYNCTLEVLGGPSVCAVADERCEEAKNVEVLIPGESVVEHHVEDISRSLNLQISISTYGNLPVQDKRWTEIRRGRVF